MNALIRFPRRMTTVALLAVLAIALAAPASAAAATVSSSYAIRGAEYYATSTQGRFAGTARGSTGDTAAWRAIVDHTPLTTTATITGGSATLVTSRLVTIRGQFSGGTVDQTSGFEGCTNQTYDVAGTLANVTRSDTGAVGTGAFDATLTHYRAWIWGRCVTYSATVSGVISLSF
jgi:hypothetical protein